MTVASETNRSGPYYCNGSTKVFPYAFRVTDAAHLRVVLTSAAGVSSNLALGTDYTVSGIGDGGGGSITTTVAYATGYSIVNLPSIPFTQEVDLANQGGYYAETVEEALDLAVRRDLQLKEEIDRCVKVSADFDEGDLEALTGAILRVAESSASVGAVAAVASSVPAVAGIADEIEAIVGMADIISGTASALLITEDTFTGTGSATTFTLSRAPGSAENVLLMVGGAVQTLADYSVSGTTLTITPAVASGLKVVARITSALTANQLAVYRDQAQEAAEAAQEAADAAQEAADAAQEAADAAQEAADAAQAAPAGHAILYDAQSLTNGQKTQARANIGLAAVAASGAYSDLSGTPSLGTAAALNVGTGANQVVRRDANGKISGVTPYAKSIVTVSGSVSVPSWATRIDIYAVGGGGSGDNQASGSTGKPGTCTYASYTVTAGSVSTLTAEIGSNGDTNTNWNYGVAGGTTTVTGTGISVSAAGGAGNGGPFSVTSSTRIPFPSGFVLPGYGTAGLGESSYNTSGAYGSTPGAVVVEFYA